MSNYLTIQRFFCILLSSAIAFLMIGCDVTHVDPIIKIGVVAPFDGEKQHIGYDLLYSVRLAVREINKAGGINGHRVTVVIYSDSTDAVRAVEAANALVIDKDVLAVLGHWHPETTMAAAPIYQAAGVAFVPMGEGILGAVDPAKLPEQFRVVYKATSFESAQQPMEWAGTAYDGIQLLFRAINYSHHINNGVVNRETVSKAITQVSIKGITGEITLSP